MFEPERAQYLARHEIGEVVERCRLLIKGRHGGQDRRAGLGAQHHVSQLWEAHRRLSRHDHERSFLFQHDVGGTFDETTDSPWATPASVFMEQGTIAMPLQRWLPLAIEAPRSRLLCTMSDPAAISLPYLRPVRRQVVYRCFVALARSEEAAPVV